MSEEADRAHRYLGHLLGEAGVNELLNRPGEGRPLLWDMVERAVTRWLAQHHVGDEARARQIAAEALTLAFNLAHERCCESDMLQHMWAVLVGRKTEYLIPIMPPQLTRTPSDERPAIRQVPAQSQSRRFVRDAGRRGPAYTRKSGASSSSRMNYE